jgi:hypothetical protein
MFNTSNYEILKDSGINGGEFSSQCSNFESGGKNSSQKIYINTNKGLILDKNLKSREVMVGN